MNRLLKNSPLLLAGGLLLLLVLNVGAFQRWDYWADAAERYFAVAILALALTPIVITGGIDLSVGAVTVFSSVVVGALWHDLGWPIGWAFVGGVLAGAAAGSINGLLIAGGVLPLVATLATRELFRGLAKRISGINGVAGFPSSLGDFWSETWLGLPTPLIFIALAAILAWVVVHQTWIGRSLFAMGDNETAARYAGVPVRTLKLGLYASAGAAAGLCGVSLICRFQAAKADVEQALDLTAIACVVLGGIRVTGGAGHVGGTIVGVITMAVLLSGLTDAAPTWRDTATGILIVSMAVINEACQRWAQRRAARVPQPLSQ